MRRTAVSLFAICVAVALAGCSGDDAEQGGSTVAASKSTASSTTAVETKDVPASNSEKGESASARGQDGDRRGAGESGDDDLTAGPHPGARSVAAGVPVQPGGDNSVQVFGAEGEVAEREQAFSTLKAYLRARAAGDWAIACAQTSEEFKEQLATLVHISKETEQKKPEGCPATLQVFLGRVPSSQMGRSATVGDLLSFRVKGGYAYVIFRGADGTVHFIAMVDEDGKWKVNTAEPGELPPGG